MAVAALCVAAGATAAPADAQLARLSLEARGGVSVPMRGFREGAAPGGGLERAPTFGATLVTRNLNGWGVALGFAQSRFACAGDGPACATPGGDGYVATDVELGGLRSFGEGRVAPWIRAGLVFGRTEYDAMGPAGMERRLTDLAAGGSAGAGVAVRVGGRWGVSPGLRFAWMNTHVPGAGVLRMRYLLADVGVLLNF